MSPTLLRLGPQDHGRRLTLDEFDDAEVSEGFHFELGRGVVIVSEVPLPKHLAIVNKLRRQLAAYDLQHPERIWAIASGGECKLPLAEHDSERHPDLAVYLTEPPLQDSNTVWSEWIPELVIEVVSAGSEDRDYVEKREEYLAFGVREYWIAHPDRREILILRRVRGQWTEQLLNVGDKYLSRVLPDFELIVGAIFGA